MAFVSSRRALSSCLRLRASRRWLCHSFSETSDVAPASVVSLTGTSSEDVKVVELKIHRAFDFKPGQWVDFVIPGDLCSSLLRPQDEGYLVGGFSITSTPAQGRDGLLQLAIQESPNRPVSWVLNDAKLGDVVGLRSGGNFWCDINTAGRPVLLISGGIGITPFMSMLRTFRDDIAKGTVEPRQTVRLLHSTRETHEIVFYDELAQLCASSQQVQAHFLCTGKGASLPASPGVAVGQGRISEKLLESFIENDTICFICGPPAMVDGTSEMLQRLGMPLQSVVTERWW